MWLNRLGCMFLGASVISIASSIPCGAQCPDWDPRFLVDGSGINGGLVRALEPFEDGVGPALAAGGRFSVPNGARGTLRWDTTWWTTVGGGISINGGDEEILALKAFDDGAGSVLFASGRFDSYYHIAKWNGVSWSQPPHPPSGAPLGANWNYDLELFDDGTGAALYVGGSFAGAGSPFVFSQGVVRWNGTSWSGLASGVPFGVVRALGGFDDGSGPKLFAGGRNANEFRAWNGTSWSAVGSPGHDPNGLISAMATFDDGSGLALYVGGSFTVAGGVSMIGIARWNGTSWSKVGGGLTGTVNALAVFDQGDGDALYATGAISTAEGNPAFGIARWNGSAWSTLGSALQGAGTPTALAVFDFDADGADDLVVGSNSTSRNINVWRGCPPGEPYCFGDGIDPLVTAQCPCGNFGQPGNGCANSVHVSGARLKTTGKLIPNTLLFTMTSVPNNTLATGLRTTTNVPTEGVMFGDGVRCQSGSLVRFGSHRTGTQGDAHQTWTSATATVAPGNTRYYQVQYRNSIAGFCPNETFNISNGVRIDW